MQLSKSQQNCHMQECPTTQECPTAIIYCEGNFGSLDGKTANGLVRHSEIYKIVAVIDSEKSGQDSGIVLDGKANKIPICRNLTDAQAKVDGKISNFIFGMAPVSGLLSVPERDLIFKVISLGMNIINGLHEFFNDDPEFLAASSAMNVKLVDVRKPPPKKKLRLFSGRITEVKCIRIAVLGTDCAIGKRTTARILTKALNASGLKAIMISTGQTGLIQGGRYGVALDAVPSQFCTGELEATIVEAFQNESPDVIVVEGQGALSHPAYSTSSFILRGSCPHGVVLQHAPGRSNLCDFKQMKMPLPSDEINLIQTFSDTRVIGLTINHENLAQLELTEAIKILESELGIPVTDALIHSPDILVNMVLTAFPKLEAQLDISSQ